MRLRGFAQSSHLWKIICCCIQLIGVQFHHADAACADLPVLLKSVNESAPAGSVIQAVDSSYTGSFTVSESQYSCYFSVSGGALILAKALDLENLTSCSDGSTTPVASVPAALSIVLTCVSSSVETLVVNLVDINEFAPAFLPNQFSASVSEAAPIGSFVIQLNSYVRDADKTSQATFNFFLLAGADAKFNMPDSATSGIIRVSGVLDFDSGQRLFSLNISAAELAGSPGPLTGFATVEVSVTDSDDQNPVFVRNAYELSFMENDSSLIGRDLTTLPLPLEARDRDLGINQTVNYAIDSGNTLNNATFLEINSTTGALRLKTVLDRETLLENPIWMRVKAFQTDKPNLRTAVTFVSVMVTDKNDNKPVMSAATYTVNLVENSPSGAFVAQIAATDSDAGSNATLVYKLADASGAFFIEPSTGTVRVANSSLLDREAASQFSMSVWAEESQSVDRFASAPSELTVQLADANDNAPEFAQPTYSFSVSATAGLGAPVGQVSATDADIGENAAIVYSLAFASPAASSTYFGLDPGNGSLTVTGQLTDIAGYSNIFLLAVAEDQAVPTTLRQRAAVAVTVALTAETTSSTAGTTPDTTPTTAASTTFSPTSTASTTSTTSAAVWNVSTSVVASRQINETHIILEMETTIFDASGRWLYFNQSTLTLLPTSVATSTVSAAVSTTPSTMTSSTTTSPSSISTSPSSTSTAPSSTSTSPSSTSTEPSSTSTSPSSTSTSPSSTSTSPSSTSTSPSSTSTSPSSTSTSSGSGVASEPPSASSSALQTALIALCALMALLLAVALVAIAYFWKRRPRGGGAVGPSIVGDGGSGGAGSEGGSGAGKHGSATARSKKERLVANRHSSRINYSEFYFDDRDVSGNPIMVLHQAGPADPTDQRPPSYSQLPRVTK